jgi:hypothetical protein
MFILTPLLSKVQMGEDLEPSNKETFWKTGSVVQTHNSLFMMQTAAGI